MSVSPADLVLPVRSGASIPDFLSRCANVAKGPSKSRTAPTFIVENQVGFLVRAVSQRNHVVFTRLMVAGLTRVQFAVLAKLLEIGSCSQNELGRLTLLDRAS